VCGLLTDCGLSTAIVGRSQTFNGPEIKEFRHITYRFYGNSDIRTLDVPQSVAQQQPHLSISIQRVL
jgi:hypothetical protein